MQFTNQFHVNQPNLGNLHKSHDYLHGDTIVVIIVKGKTSIDPSNFDEFY